MSSTITNLTSAASVNHDSNVDTKKDAGTKNAGSEAAALGEQLTNASAYTGKRTALALRNAAKQKPSAEVNEPIDVETQQTFNKSTGDASTEDAETFLPRILQYMPGVFVRSAGWKSDASQSEAGHTDGLVDSVTSQVFGKSPISAQSSKAMSEIMSFAGRMANAMPGHFRGVFPRVL